MIYDGQVTLEEVNEEYAAFADKFKPKKTTDDCYTPPIVFDAIQGWACKRYNIDASKIVRPFYPGGNYRKFDYAEDAVVLDNPPFSILGEIIGFYNAQGVPFFLYGPALTILNYAADNSNCCICANCTITYENGAVVPTAFITNMDSEFLAYSCPELHQIVKEANAKSQKEKKQTRELPKYDYPDYVITSAKLQYYSGHQTKFTIRKKDAFFIRALDAQKAVRKAVFGGGLLLSEKAAAEKAAAEKAAAEKAAAEKAAAEKAAAEKAAAEKWTLSERELEIVRMIGKRNEKGAEL